MRIDYHMHFEYGSYDLEWVQGFFDHARQRGIDEIGITEHSHGFREFKDLYQDELILGESLVGRYQRQWLAKGKFRHTLEEYLEFMALLKKKGYPVKTGIEVCNFRDQNRVREILDRHRFDYIIGSVHFLNGWGYDFAEIKQVWDDYPLRDIYEWYTQAIVDLCRSAAYDILGHPFNLRLFRNFPDFDVAPLLDRAAAVLQEAGMAIDVNTGTLYRYPVREISPYPLFMEAAKRCGLPIILSSDAHRPEDCGRFIDQAEEYVKQFGYEEVLVFTDRQAVPHRIG